ncbi:hypothetical protein C8Q74DRAFT_515579 [Fomes fomentarius]|nr:hypothetical protein C8Q74DRAFT_515579 [Fomes fomentarius]
MFDSYHAPKVPTTVPDLSLATFALLRKIATPLAHQQHTTRTDTGFWRDVEQELDRLFELYGKDRNSEQWLNWIQQMLKEDEERVPARQTRRNRTRRQRGECNSSLDPASGSENNGEDNDYGVNDADADRVLEHEFDGDENMFEDGASNSNAHAAPRTDEHDGDIDISQVAGGDIASTM